MKLGGDEAFAEKMQKLTERLGEQMAKDAELDQFHAVQVLELGNVFLDGTKVHANASRASALRRWKSSSRPKYRNCSPPFATPFSPA